MRILSRSGHPFQSNPYTDGPDQPDLSAVVEVNDAQVKRDTVPNPQNAALPPDLACSFAPVRRRSVQELSQVAIAG